MHNILIGGVVVQLKNKPGQRKIFLWFIANKNINNNSLYKTTLYSCAEQKKKHLRTHSVLIDEEKELYDVLQCAQDY